MLLLHIHTFSVALSGYVAITLSKLTMDALLGTINPYEPTFRILARGVV